MRLNAAIIVAVLAGAMATASGRDLQWDQGISPADVLRTAQERAANAPAVPAAKAVVQEGSGAAALHWYRGNTHTHSNRKGGDSTPEEVVRWYVEHGYNFMSLTDHGMLTRLAPDKLPPAARNNFILLPGAELFAGNHHGMHLTALNVSKMDLPLIYIPREGDISRWIDKVGKWSGLAIVNHPHSWARSAADLGKIKNFRLFELNGGLPAIEAMWDELLSQGRVIYAVASDDAHTFKTATGPGRGWVMVRAAQLTPQAITAALQAGDFYASNGVFLKNVAISPDAYAVEVDEQASAAEIALGLSPGLRPAQNEAPGWKIDFIGPGGKVVSSVAGCAAACPRAGQAYLRAKASLTTKDKQGQLVQYSAWCQPAFSNSRP